MTACYLGLCKGALQGLVLGLQLGLQVQRGFPAAGFPLQPAGLDGGQVQVLVAPGEAGTG